MPTTETNWYQVAKMYEAQRDQARRDLAAAQARAVRGKHPCWGCEDVVDGGGIQVCTEGVYRCHKLTAALEWEADPADWRKECADLEAQRDAARRDLAAAQATLLALIEAGNRFSRAHAGCPRENDFGGDCGEMACDPQDLAEFDLAVDKAKEADHAALEAVVANARRAGAEAKQRECMGLLIWPPGRDLWNEEMSGWEQGIADYRETIRALALTEEADDG
jgi:hypothetical protein